MSLYDDVSAQIKDAMRSQDKDRLVALRSIRAGFIEAQKLNGAATVSDADCLDVLRRLAKQRVDSIESYGSAGRGDLAEVERRELAVIDGFLPKLADEATTRAWVAEAIAATGATGSGELGRVMGALMKAHKAEMDGKLANRIARELLS